MDEARMTEYLAECLWPGVTEADLTALDARARAATTASEVRYLGSRLVPSDEVVFCFFEGSSVEAVRVVAERAAIPFERILASVHVPANQSDREETTT